MNYLKFKSEAADTNPCRYPILGTPLTRRRVPEPPVRGGRVDPVRRVRAVREAQAIYEKVAASREQAYKDEGLNTMVDLSLVTGGKAHARKEEPIEAINLIFIAVVIIITGRTEQNEMQYSEQCNYGAQKITLKEQLSNCGELASTNRMAPA